MKFIAAWESHHSEGQLSRTIWTGLATSHRGIWNFSILSAAFDSYQTTQISDWAAEAVLDLPGGVQSGLCVSEFPYVFRD